MTSAIHPAFVLNEHVRKVYDGYNRAVEFETVKPTGITIAKMTYNGDNLRVTRQVERVQDGKTETISYLYDGAYVMREEASGQTDRPASLRYIVGTSYVGHIDSNDNVQMYLYNGHGDTIEVFDTSRNVLNTYDYDIFGKSTESNESSYETHIRYAGEYYDSDTGFYYLRARYYNPVTGRFVNEDSVWGKKHQPLSLNLYTYAYNNPVRFIDPSGHVVTDWDKNNLSNKEQKKVARFGQAWSRARDNYDKAKSAAEKNKYQRQMDQAHSYAKRIREANIKDGSRVQSNGYVVNTKVKQEVATGGRNEYSDSGILRGKYEKQKSRTYSSNTGYVDEGTSNSSKESVDNSKTVITEANPVVNNVSQIDTTKEVQDLVADPTTESDVSGLIIHKDFANLDKRLLNNEEKMHTTNYQVSYQGEYYEGDDNPDNGVDLRAETLGIGSPEGEDYYIKVYKTRFYNGDVGGSTDFNIVNGQINNVGSENANIDLSGSFGRLYGGAVFDKQEGMSGEVSITGYAAIVEAQANIEMKGKDTQTTIGLAPSGGSIGGHFKGGVNYTDENGVYHYVNVEVGGALGFGAIAKLDVTNQ